MTKLTSKELDERIDNLGIKGKSTLSDSKGNFQTIHYIYGVPDEVRERVYQLIKDCIEEVTPERLPMADGVINVRSVAYNHAIATIQDNTNKLLGEKR